LYRLRRQHPHGELCIETAHRCTFQHLLAGGLDWLAHLGRDGQREFIRLLFEQSCQLPHPQCAMFDGHRLAAPEGIGCEPDTLPRLRLVQRLEAPQQFAIGRVDRFDCHALKDALWMPDVMLTDAASLLAAAFLVSLQKAGDCSVSDGSGAAPTPRS